jgi:hypothetical protein
MGRRLTLMDADFGFILSAKICENLRPKRFVSQSAAVGQVCLCLPAVL